MAVAVVVEDEEGGESDGGLASGGLKDLRLSDEGLVVYRLGRRMPSGGGRVGGAETSTGAGTGTGWLWLWLWWL